MTDKIFDRTIGSLNTALNLRQMNQNVISSNIANADTPGYKAKRLGFEEQLREVLNPSNEMRVQAKKGSTSTQGDDPIEPEVYDDPNGIESLDGNTVNRSDEMARMAENQIQYDTAVELLRKKLGMLKYAIADGGSGGGQ